MIGGKIVNFHCVPDEQRWRIAGSSSAVLTQAFSRSKKQSFAAPAAHSLLHADHDLQPWLQSFAAPRLVLFDSPETTVIHWSANLADVVSQKPRVSRTQQEG